MSSAVHSSNKFGIKLTQSCFMLVAKITCLSHNTIGMTRIINVALRSALLMLMKMGGGSSQRVLLILRIVPTSFMTIRDTNLCQKDG